MTSITKISNKQGVHYKVIYDLPPLLNGSRRRTSKTFPVGTPLSVAKEFAAEKELEKKRGTALSEGFDVDFAAFADNYFNTYTQFLSPSTLRGYRLVYTNSKPHGVRNYFGNTPMKKITQKHIQEYVNYLSTCVSPKTAKNFIMLLKVIFTAAIKEHIIPEEKDPMRNIIKPRQKKRQIEAYNMEEFNLLLKLAEEDENETIKLILNLALLSGIRRGEMAGLKWEDVHFDEKYLFIHENRLVVYGKEYIKEPKTDAGIRKIFIPDQLLEVLAEYRQKYLIHKIQKGASFADRGYVVSKPDGNPFTPQGITNCYLRFMKRHKDQIRYLKFHGLRHTYASILIELGENPKTVQHNLGHADVALTLQIYSHSFESAQKEAARKLSESIDKFTSAELA